MKERRNTGRLTGRDAELARILDLAATPSTGAVLITGPTGIGKSLLAEAAMVELTTRGWRGFGLSATGSTARVPYAALSELVPETVDALAEIAPADREMTVLRALERALGLDDSTRAALVVDDIAGIDGPSCDLLVHLATNRRAFILASQNPGSGHGEALRRLTPAAVTELELESLPVAATGELAASLLDAAPGPGLVRNLHARTLGNPLFITELITGAVERGSIDERDGVMQLVGDLGITPSLGRQIMFRLGLVTGPERDVLELLAMAGELDVEDLTATIEPSGLEAMERRGLIRTSPERGRLLVSLGHPLHRDAVEADMTPLARRRRNAELVSLIEARTTRRPVDEILLQIARLAGGQAVEVADLVDAATEALRLDRIRDASDLASAAYATEPSEDTLALLAEALIRQGRFVEAEELYATDVAVGTGDWVRLRRAVRRSSNHLWGFRDAAEALRIDDEVLSHLTDADAIDRVVAHKAWVHYCDGRPLDALALTDDLTSSTHPDVRFAVCAARAPALVITGRVDEGADLARTAWENGWGADTEYGSHNQHLIALGFAHLYQGDLPGARFVAESAIEVCRERNEVTPLLFFLELAAQTELLAGDLVTAISYLQEAFDIGSEVAIASSVRTSLAGAAIARCQLGDLDKATEAWERLDSMPPAPGPRGGAEIRAAGAWHNARTGNPPDAAGELRRAAAAAGAAGLHVDQLLMLFDVARLGYATSADADAAARCGEVCQGQMLPQVAAAIGAWVASAPETLDAEAAALHDLGFERWAADIATEARDAWTRAGNQRAATASSRLAETARSAFTTVEASPAAQPIEPLSRREREVATLAAGGATNAAIADQLHLSVRTVETHLQKVYRKLGITGRRELSAALT